MNLDNMSQNEIKNYISLMFEGYNARKKKNELYQVNDVVPKLIIGAYYSYIDNPQFDNIFTKFKDKYIHNENLIENVHTKSEREGMGVVYDYIHNFVKPGELNLYILLKLHGLLYSKVPFPEFGGKFRNEEVYLPGTGIDIIPYGDVPFEFQKLYSEANSLIEEGKKLSYQKDYDSILMYIDKCVLLSCKLIKIHPFKDGNGRTIRAFMNLLFKLANIPPVYVSEREQVEYRQAMQKALTVEDYSSILTFYYYKICDSIIELDIVINDEKNKLK